ncbi:MULTISPECIES: twin-arginine translocation signal domain-containing protein [Salinirubellus]|uniref:twin-arginine translocation signal domain-containing protein n=1 Tax=Salinirubellus TaxID=2162630 RepID=UPI0030D2F0B3
MTITNHGEESRDRTGHDGTGCGRPRRTFLKGVGLLGAGAVFGPSLASPVGATPESSIPSLAAALDTPALGTEFEVTYGGGGEDRFSDVVQASDGGYVLTGITRSPRGDRRGLVVKTDDEGAIEWEWVDTDRNPSILRTVVELDDGYIFGGQANGTSLVTYRYWLLKTDFDGNVLWERTYGVPGYYANARAAIPTADGGFAIAGEAAPSGKGIDFYLVKTDGNGDQEWARSYGSAVRERGGPPPDGRRRVPPRRPGERPVPRSDGRGRKRTVAETVQTIGHSTDYGARRGVRRIPPRGVDHSRDGRR